MTGSADNDRQTRTLYFKPSARKYRPVPAARSWSSSSPAGCRAGTFSPA